MKWGDVTLDINRIDEGAQFDHPFDEWYFNAILSSPGNPVDGWAFKTIYTIFSRGVAENVHGLLIPPSGDIVDLSGYELTPGSILTSEAGVDVQWEKNWCRGKYPQWVIHFEGEYQGQKYGVDLEFEADVPSVFLDLKFDPSYFNQFVLIRNKAKGKITIGDKSYPVTGLGYSDHLYGLFNPLGSKGWYWYWVPVTERDRMAVNLGILVDQNLNMPVKFLYFTPDGKQYHAFDDFEFNTIEEKEFGGVTYPVKFSLEEKNSEGELKAIISRSPYCYSRLNESPIGTAIFITGFARMEGNLTWQGKDYDLEGRSIGSVALFKMND